MHRGNRNEDARESLKGESKSLFSAPFVIVAILKRKSLGWGRKRRVVRLWIGECKHKIYINRRKFSYFTRRYPAVIETVDKRLRYMAKAGGKKAMDRPASSNGFSIFALLWHLRLVNTPLEFLHWCMSKVIGQGLETSKSY